MNSARGDRYVALDGIRGICAVAVMFYHYTAHSDSWIFKNAGFAVDVFFALSGYVLAAVYIPKFETENINIFKFMGIRIVRLYPLMFLSIILGGIGLFSLRSIGLSSYSTREILVSIVHNAMFMPYLNEGVFHMFGRSHETLGSVSPINGPMWSLFMEFYINIFMLYFAFFSIKNLTNIVICSGVLFITLGVVNAFAVYYGVVAAEVGPATDTFFPAFVRVGFGFAMGVLIYRLNRSGLKSILNFNIFDKFINKIAQYPWLLYLGLFIFLVFPFDIYGVSYIFSAIVLSPLLLIIGTRTQFKNSISKNLSQFLGWISYPIYCLHTPVGNILAFFIKKEHLDIAYGLPFSLIASAITVILAIILTKVYEEPVRKWILLKTLYRKSIRT
jgi:peptidoglycan/LPS O-acetylase OafA/YrhL